MDLIVNPTSEKSSFYNVKPDKLMEKFLNNINITQEDQKFIRSLYIENYIKSDVSKLKGSYHTEVSFL